MICVFTNWLSLAHEIVRFVSFQMDLHSHVIDCKTQFLTSVRFYWFIAFAIS